LNFYLNKLKTGITIIEKSYETVVTLSPQIIFSFFLSLLAKVPERGVEVVGGLGGHE